MFFYSCTIMSIRNTALNINNPANFIIFFFYPEALNLSRTEVHMIAVNYQKKKKKRKNNGNQQQLKPENVQPMSWVNNQIGWNTSDKSHMCKNATYSRSVICSQQNGSPATATMKMSRKNINYILNDREVVTMSWILTKSVHLFSVLMNNWRMKNESKNTLNLLEIIQ